MVIECFQVKGEGCLPGRGITVDHIGAFNLRVGLNAMGKMGGIDKMLLDFRQRDRRSQSRPGVNPFTALVDIQDVAVFLL